MLFLRNTIISADYIRRGRVKRKELFYALFISQAAGLATFVILSASYFVEHVNCRVWVQILIHLAPSSTLWTLAWWLSKGYSLSSRHPSWWATTYLPKAYSHRLPQLSGILGLKAYRCLNNSKFVLAVVILLQVTSSVFVLLDLSHIQATRRLSSESLTLRRLMLGISK